MQMRFSETQTAVSMDSKTFVGFIFWSWRRAAQLVKWFHKMVSSSSIGFIQATALVFLIHALCDSFPHRSFRRVCIFAQKGTCSDRCCAIIRSKAAHALYALSPQHMMQVYRRNSGGPKIMSKTQVVGEYYKVFHQQSSTALQQAGRHVCVQRCYQPSNHQQQG